MSMAWVHRLSHIQEGSAIAVCDHCGLVPVKKKGGTYRCVIRIRMDRRVSPVGPQPPARHPRKAKHRLGKDGYEKMYAEQGGKCLICGTHREILSVDHDHSTDEIRGLLCPNCNTGLGMFKDDPDVMEAAIRYLRR